MPYDEYNRRRHLLSSLDEKLWSRQPAIARGKDFSARRFPLPATFFLDRGDIFLPVRSINEDGGRLFARGKVKCRREE
jgi:hypothetical protein